MNKDYELHCKPEPLAEATDALNRELQQAAEDGWAIEVIRLAKNCINALVGCDQPDFPHQTETLEVDFFGDTAEAIIAFTYYKGFAGSYDEPPEDEVLDIHAVFLMDVNIMPLLSQENLDWITNQLLENRHEC